MGINIKVPIKFNANVIERLFTVLAMLCGLSGGYKLLRLPAEHFRWDIPVWQFVGGILIFCFGYIIYDLLGNE